MDMRISDLWRWRGVIDRVPYAVWGILLAAVKYGIDSTIVQMRFGRHLPLIGYWFPGTVFGPLEDATEGGGLISLMAVAVPFAYMGVALTVKRLRDASLPAWLVLLFFVPFLNLLLFMALVCAPSRLMFVEPLSIKENRWFDRVMPGSMIGAALTSLVLSAIPCVILVTVGTVTLRNYGWGLFLGIPFLLGFISTVVYSYHHPRSLPECIGVSMTSLMILAGLIAVFAIEGFVCLLMASPIAIAGTFLGALTAWALPPFRHRTGRTYASLLGLMPLALAIEAGTVRDPGLIEVRTAIEIDAPPDVVWRHVIEFSDLPPPTEWYFRAGIAYPTRAVIHGEGVGAVRHCMFTTGSFVEPITRWDEPYILEFDVTEQPKALRELMLWHGAEPPHVDGYLVSRRGRFRLEPIDGRRRTRLEGTTWYTHRLWPEPYWRLWSDWLIGRIHARVLNHIGACAESGN